MKRVKYYMTLVASVVCYAAPVFILLAAVYQSSITLAVIGCILFACGLVLSKFLTKARIYARQAVEYDEFGISKSKGHYDRLSRSERDQIDLQRTARMEQIVNSGAIKKMTHEGSVDPQKDMDEMVGLSVVKEKMAEMVARMKFESENKTLRSANGISGRHMVFFGSPGQGKQRSLGS